MVTASASITNLINRQDRLNYALSNEYERVISEKESVIREQSEIIEKQKAYIYNLLSEIDHKPLIPSLKLNFAKFFSFIF